MEWAYMYAITYMYAYIYVCNNIILDPISKKNVQSGGRAEMEEWWQDSCVTNRTNVFSLRGVTISISQLCWSLYKGDGVSGGEWEEDYPGNQVQLFFFFLS